MKRILLTGATGRVGANLIPRLLEKGYAVRAFVMPNDSQLPKLNNFDIEIFEGVMSEKADVDRAMDGCDIVIHLGAVIAIGNMPERAFWDVNVTGTFELTRSAVRHNVQRFLFASTDATYSCWNPVYTPISEAHPQRPFFLYGVSKKVCEELLFEAQRETNMPIVIMRFSNVKCCDEILDAFTVASLNARLKGYSSHPGSSVYRPDVPHPEEQIQDLLDNPQKLVIPRGPDFRSWMEHHVDVRDLIQGILLSLEKDEAVGEVFNFAAPEPSSWEVAVKTIVKYTNESYHDIQIKNFWSYEIDITKAKTVLGYNPVYGIDAMVRDALDYKAGKDLRLIPARI